MKSTREDIVDAALRLVHVRGFNNTTIEDILKESDFGKGNFYYYFKSKDELGFAILERVLQHLNSELIEKSFDQSKNPWQQLNDFLDEDELVERARQRECSGGCILGNLAVEMSDIHEEFRLRLNKAFDQLRTCVEKALTQARAQGTLRSNADIPGLALFTIAGFEGTFMMGKLQEDADVVASVVEELKEHLAHFRAAK